MLVNKGFSTKIGLWGTGQPIPLNLKKENMSKKDLVKALKEELKHYENYGKAKRAEQVKKEIKKLGGKIEDKSAKPKAEKKTVKK